MKFSVEVTRGTAAADVEKAGERRPANVATTSLAQVAAELTTDAPARGTPPDPGPLPTSTPSPTTPADPVGLAPVRYSFPWATNQTVTPRGENRQLAPFAQLRQLAEVCDMVRIAIEARKDQMTSLKWDFAPRERSHSKRMSAGETARIKELREFFRRPDKVHGWNTWLRMLVEEVLVVDALSIYRRQTRGGALFGLELIDGTTIKPLLSPRGFVPAPPQVAYRQIISGVPVQGGDCTVDQLLYRPRTVRTWTPYGLSATECVMLTVNTALNRQLFNLGYYSEGNIPEGLVSTPEGWSTDQIRQFQEYWDSLMAGNYKQRQRLRFVGPKMAESVYQFKKESFDTKFDEWLLQVVCAAFGVQPQELGFTQQINKSQGESQENITYRRGVKPLGGFVKDIVDEVLIDSLGAADFECIYTGGESEDRKQQAEIDDIYVRIGKVSIDELRARDGEEMIGLGPIVFTTSGPVFVEQLIKDKDNNPLTSSPTSATPIGTDGKPVAESSFAHGSRDADGDGKTGEGAGKDDDDEDDVETMKAVDDELRSFKRFVVKRIAKSGSAVAAAAKFESDVLDRNTLTAIAKSIDARGVAATFEQVEKAAAPKRTRAQAQSKYRKFMKSYFSDLATALSAHVATQVEKGERE